jgi:YbbR domain-containing protein
MIRWILDNLGNMLLSIVLAVLVWVVAVQEANPNVERTFSTPIPIAVQNLPPGMITYGESARSVRVTLSAPQTAWDVLSADRINATIDLSGQLTGTLELPVHVAVSDRTVQVTKIEPSVISLKMEPLTEAQLPVTLNVVGNPALGYTSQPVKAEPSSVSVSGPASLVQQIASIGGQVSIQDARAPISQTVSLTPRSSDGQTVSYVTLTPSSTLAMVGITQISGFRDLAVKIDLRGNPAPGFLIASVTPDPQIVTVFGSPTDLDALPGFIQTQPVTVTNATEDINQRVRLDLPSGVSMLGDPTVQVSVRINPIESSITVQRTPIIQGLLPGYSARLSPEVVDVILSGPISSLDTLRSDDVQVLLNLLNLGEGTHQITPDVLVPNGVTVASVLPASIQVTIGQDITVTETISGTLTPITGTLTPTPAKP